MRKQITLAIALSLLGIPAIAQNSSVRSVPGAPGMYPQVLEFPAGLEPDFTQGTVVFQQQDGVIRSSETVLANQETDQIGQQHFRYQQKINGIPVENAIYVVHVASGKILRENGEWISEVPKDLLATASISESTALTNAMTAFGARLYKWQIPAEEAFIKKESGNPDASFFPKASLVYYSGENSVSPDNLRLAYKLDLYAQTPVGRRLYFIDAQTGKVLGTREVMHTVNATGTAVTAYSGTQSITTDQVSTTSYRLRETGRGNGIQTYNLATSTNYSAATDFTDADNNWNNVNATWDQYATDAHWGAEKTYDYYKNTYGRNSINNAGFAILSYVHYSVGYFNAFWDGTRMTYGDGGSTDGNKPLTAIDVCGHEITHGLTSYTANLTYSNESGAMNEGFSDIFGTAIEFYSKPATANWLIGEAFYTIRDMSNPNAYGQPDTYLGTNWATGTADNGGVHTNSGVLNFWFYLLSQGGTGTNDKNTAYAVTGIGITKAAAIAYRTLTNYLTPTSQYANARTLSVQAATDLYGATSNEVTQVNNAWNAVGVAATVTPPPCTDNYESNESISAAKVIALNTDLTGKIGTATDKDYYKFTTLSTAPKLKVTLTNLPKNYNLVLFNSSGKQLGASSNSGTTAESITYNTATTAATYYIEVLGVSSAYSATSCYTFRVATGSVNQLVDENSADITDDLTNTSAMNNNDLLVYPNPAKGQLSIRFTASQEGNQDIYVTDLMGRTISRLSVPVTEGINTITLPLNNYVPGMYFLNVVGQQKTRFQVAE